MSPSRSSDSEVAIKGNPELLDAIDAIYTNGKEYAAKKYSMTYFDVGKTPDFMKPYGLTGERFTIRYGVISRHVGRDSEHDLTESVWRQLPKALQTPFAITKYFADNDKKHQKGYRLYTTLQLPNGSYVVVSAEVKNAGRDIEVNSINTIFGRTKLSDKHDELIYISEKITPEQQALLNGNNPHQYPDEREINVSSAGKVTEKTGNEQEKAEENSQNSFGAVEPEEAESEPQPAEKGYTVEQTTYTNKKGKTSDVWLVKFDRELTKEQLRAGKEMAKEPLPGRKTSKGWWDANRGGFLMRSEEAANESGEKLGNAEAVRSIWQMNFARPVSVLRIMRGR